MLYLAVKCQGAPQKANIRQRDGNCWEDDSIDIFLRPNPGETTFYHLIFSASGAIYDERNRGGSDFHFQRLASAVSRETDGWILEAAIPWKELGVAKEELHAPRELGLNVCRTEQGENAFFSSWSHARLDFYNLEGLGRLRIADAPSQEILHASDTSSSPVRFHLLFREEVEEKCMAPHVQWLQKQIQYSTRQEFEIPQKGGIWLIGKFRPQKN